MTRAKDRDEGLSKNETNVVNFTSCYTGMEATTMLGRLFNENRSLMALYL
jgi:hypothetical protein